MGGKKKEAQRTKGNVKPASSGRAAQLLEASGGLQTGFVGFDALSGDLGYVPASLQGSGEAAECGDGELRMVMKRLTKRDAVTKLKALQNFNEICQEREKEVVTDALRYWPRLYSKLALDHDRRVREAAQEALKQIAVRSGRDLAPHLKHLIGAWMLSFCDTHAPAASAAKAAFSAVFTSECKQSDTVAYCCSELVKYLTDMLYNSSPQTLSDAKTTPLEEMEEKYERVVSSSLLCLRLVITMYPSAKISDLTKKYRDVLDPASFWKYANHSNTAIKSAFYSLLSGVIHSMPELANEKASKICGSVLSKLNETDPVVCASVWEAALCTVSYIKEFWMHVNIRKAMLPSLWSALKKGFEGSATTIAPNLLPLLSKLPVEVTGSNREFYGLLFSHMRTGLSQERVGMSSAECNAIVRAYIECMRYAISRCVDIDDLSLVEELLQTHLFSVLEQSLLESPAQMSKSCLYPQLSLLVISLHSKQNNNELSTRARECYSCARDLSWEAFKMISKKCVETDNSYSMTRLISLLKSIILYDQESTKTSSSRHVGFVKRRPASHEPSKQKTISESHPELENTLDLAASVSVSCLQAQSEENNKLSYVVSICELCSSLEFYTKLAVELGGKSAAYVIDECRTILSRNTSVWNDIVKIILLVTKYVDEEQALNTLIKLTQALDSTCVGTLLNLVNSYDWLDGIRSSWLANQKMLHHVDVITAQLMTALDNEVESEVESCLSFIQTLITCSRSGVHSGVYALLHHSLKGGQDEKIVELCYTIRDKVIERLSLTENSSLVVIICQYLLTMTDQQLSINSSSLVSQLLMWLITHPTDTGSSFDVVYNLLEKVTADLSDYDSMIVCIQSYLDSTQSTCNDTQRTCNDTQSSIRSVSVVCARLSHSLNPHTFTQSFIEKVTENIDEHQLFKWLSVQTMKGQYSHQTTHDYIEYQTSSPQLTCPAIILYTLFLADYLSLLIQGHNYSIDDISSDLLLRIHSTDAWISRVLETLHGADSFLSTSCIETLHQFVSNPDRNQLLLKNLLDQSDRDRVWTCLALESISKYLPRGDGSLMCMVLSYLSSYEKLSDESLSCLNTLLHTLNSEQSAQVTDLLAARLVSAEEDKESETQMCEVSSTLHLLSVSLDRVYKPDISEQVVLGVLQYISTWKSEHPQQLISEKHPYMAEIDSDRLKYNIAVMRYFAQVVRNCPHLLSSAQWDLILVTLSEWIGVEKCILPVDLSIFPNQHYLSNVMSLLAAVGNLMKNDVSKSPEEFPKDFLAEWVELYALTIYSMLLPYFVTLAGSPGKASQTVQLSFVLACLSNAISHCPPQSIKQHKLPIKLVPDQTHILPANQESALNHLVPLLLSPCTAVQSACFVLLNSLMPTLPEYDTVMIDDDSEGRCPPAVLMSMLDHCGAQLLSLVGGTKIGVDKPLHLGAYSEELCCVRAYLLTWKLLLKYLQYASNEQMAEYSYHLKQNHYTSDLLLVMFSIIPLEESLPNNDTFSYTTQLDFSSVCGVEEVISLACSVYYNLIKVLPALVRSWYTDLEKKANLLLDKFTSKYVSPRLCTDELEQIYTQSTLSAADNLNVKVRSAAREIIATYTLEEFSIELLIVLPANYPVGTTNVECSKKLGVATSEWRKWMLQLTTFLTYQNGSVANAITLWKKNLDKKFEGVEECYICFSVLHGTNLQLPKQQCRTCKKKFHSNCLYKWFTSSQKSTCPLCRNLF